MAISNPAGRIPITTRTLLTRKISYPYFNSVSGIHEALHNLTGENDVAIRFRILDTAALSRWKRISSLTTL